MNNFWLTITVAVLFLLSACTRTVTIELNPKLVQKPIVPLLPLTIGVYKSPEFVNWVEKREVSGTLWVIWPLGQSSSRLFDQIVASMFTEVASVSSTNPKLLPPRQGLAGIIAIDFESFISIPIENQPAWIRYLAGGTHVKQPIQHHDFTQSITYRISIIDSNGSLVAEWPVTGKDTGAWSGIFSKDTALTEYAMLDAMAKFMVDFYDKPEVIRWLNSHGINVGSP